MERGTLKIQVHKPNPVHDLMGVDGTPVFNDGWDGTEHFWQKSSDHTINCSKNSLTTGVEGSAKELSLGCVKRAPPRPEEAKGGQDAGITQPIGTIP